MTCQVGAEQAVKHELASRWPLWRFAYSRPGFLTFKLPDGDPPADDFHLNSVFARAYSISLGVVRDEPLAARAAKTCELAGGRTFDALHVWPRDLHAPGDHGFEPSITDEAHNAAAAIRAAATGAIAARGVGGQATRRGDLVLDVVIVQPNEWFVGYHRARRVATLWPGGMMADVDMPAHAVSRAYLKMEEALRWSRLPVRRGDTVIELGCSPGGSCQALLDRELRVIGVDPADVDAAVLAHPNFQHLKKRASDIRRREFRGVPWLAADMNVAPGYTLDAVESIVTHRGVRVRGMLLTLKMLDWRLAEEVPSYLERVASWGFEWVRARQLHHNRQEICLAALRERS